MRKFILSCAIALGLVGAADAQSFNLPNNSTVTGHLVAGGGNPPVGTTCTMAAGSTDSFGACTTTSTSGAITFNVPWITAPNCSVTDSTANAATNAYTVSTTAITLGTVTSGHLLQYICIGKVGG